MAGINKIVFYNHFGNGDVFESREFVKEWVEKLPDLEYYYAHGKNPKILRDIPKLQFTEVTPEMQPMKTCYAIDDTYYINTWIGRDGKYVLPGIGCVVEMLYRMHNDMLRQSGLSPLTKPILDYIPNIDYAYYNTMNISKWVTAHSERKIYISNGPVQSNQAKNFDMNGAIASVAIKHSACAFIVTQLVNFSLPNVYYLGDIVQDSEGFDLNEASYLSTFCDTIIGRNSGPHVFAQVKSNWLDRDKLILSFTYRELAATFVLNQPVKMQKYWSEATEEGHVIDTMNRAIERL